MTDEPVVWVGRSSSQCSACKGNADPNEGAHIRGGPSSSGFAEGSALSDENGCRVVWVRRVNMYSLDESDDQHNWTDMSKPFWPEPEPPR